MENQVFRDPSVKDRDSFRVVFNDRICTPDFNSTGAAAAYLGALSAGYRSPEYSAIRGRNTAAARPERVRPAAPLRRGEVVCDHYGWWFGTRADRGPYASREAALAAELDEPHETEHLTDG